MRKILLSLGLLSVMALCCGAVAAADDDTPKKGKFGGKLKDKLGKGNFGKIDHEKLFEKLDANNDGKLSKEEFRKVYQNLGNSRIPEQLRERLEKQADAAFEKLDKDNDGSLSKKEFEEFRGGFAGGNLGDLREKLKDKGLGGLLEKFKDKGFGDKFGKKKEEKKDN